MDKIKSIKQQIRLKEWAERISECQTSGMSVSAWCSANDIRPKTYYYWLRKVRTTLIEHEEELSSISLPAKTDTENLTFRQLQIQPEVYETYSPILIHLNNATLEVNSGTDQKTLEAVLMALKKLC